MATDACIAVGSNVCNRVSSVASATCTVATSSCSYVIDVVGPSSLTGSVVATLRVKPVLAGPYFVKEAGYPLGSITVAGYRVVGAVGAISILMPLVASVFAVAIMFSM